MDASPLGAQALARAALTYLAEPGDPALGALLETRELADVLAAIKAVTGSWRRGVPAKLWLGVAAGGHGPALLATGVLPVRRPAP